MEKKAVQSIRDPKRLDIFDLSIGDWVQFKKFDRFTPPMCITALFDNGDVYAVIDPEQGDPFEYNTNNKEVYSLPVTQEILEGFGFEKSSGQNYWNVDDIYRLDDISYVAFLHNTAMFNIPIYKYIVCYIGSISEMQHLYRIKVGKDLKLTWKGYDKERTDSSSRQV